jgi:hypothetical protein
MLRSLFVVLTLVLALPAAALAAQDATSSSAQSGPSCDVAPQSADELIAIAFPQGTPVAQPVGSFVIAAESEVPQGTLADAATAAAADQVVQSWLVCHMGGETARYFALMTDKLDAFYLQHFVTRLTGDSPEELRRLLESGTNGTLFIGSTEPLASLDGDVLLLDDGRVGGIWTVEGNRAFYILAEEDGSWKLDDIIDIIDE